MRGKESSYYKIPSLDLNSAIQREVSRSVAVSQIPPERKAPSLGYATRMARREFLPLMPQEQVASIDLEHDDHTKPALLAEQAVHITTDIGSGWLPVSSSHRLDHPEELAEIKEIYFVQHGCLRNAVDYRNNFINSFGDFDDIDRKYTLIIAPQFPAPVDLEEKGMLWNENTNGRSVMPKDVLRWNYHEWRGGEPTVASSPPIDSFTAMDELVEYALSLCPDAFRVRFRGNSEGGQFNDRYLAYSKALKRVEQRGIEVTGFVQNPGTVHYFNTDRPVFTNVDMKHRTEDIEWIKVPQNSLANMWPFGLYEAPPYVLEHLQEYPLETVINDYMRRASLIVGGNDSDSQGSQLPVGPGPDEQGSSRYDRVVGKHRYLLSKINTPRDPRSQVRLVIFNKLDHAAPAMFDRLDRYLEGNDLTVGKGNDTSRNWWNE